MNDKAKELAEAYVDGMDDIVDKLKELPISGKIGTKIGFALGWNPVTPCIGCEACEDVCPINCIIIKDGQAKIDNVEINVTKVRAKNAIQAVIEGYKAAKMGNAIADVVLKVLGL